jgi:hypothetical protein
VTAQDSSAPTRMATITALRPSHSWVRSRKVNTKPANSIPEGASMPGQTGTVGPTGEGRCVPPACDGVVGKQNCQHVCHTTHATDELALRRRDHDLQGWLVSFSHLVPTASGEGWCGHNCDVRVELTGPPDRVGMVWDFGALWPAKEVFERVDHRHLDDLLPGLPAV